MRALARVIFATAFALLPASTATSQATRLPALPLEIATDAPRPAARTPEGQLLARWARITGGAPTELGLRAERVDSVLFGDGALVRVSGLESARTSSRHLEASAPVEHFLVEPGTGARSRLGRRIVVRLAQGTPRPTRDRRTGPSPWLLGLLACPDTPIAPSEEVETLRPRCGDLGAALAASLGPRLRATADGDAARALVSQALAELHQLESRDRFVSVVALSQVQGPTPERFFRAFEITRHAERVVARGTASSSVTCGAAIAYEAFELVVEASAITLTRERLATVETDARCL